MRSDTEQSTTSYHDMSTTDPDQVRAQEDAAWAAHAARRVRSIAEQGGEQS